MEFSFSNSTYTTLLALFAAILGVGYPLIIQAIGEIDKKYGSTLLMKCFEGEKIYKCFNKYLLISVFCAVPAPFILSFCNDLPYLQICILAVISIVILLLIKSLVKCANYLLTITIQAVCSIY